MRCIQNLTQSYRTKQKDNSLHKMNLSAHNHTNINTLSQMKLIENRAVWGALIVHEKNIKLEGVVTQEHQNFIILPELILIILDIHLNVRF